MKFCNHEKREELGWKSVFEIYYGRKPSELLNDWKSHNKTFTFQIQLDLPNKTSRINITLQDNGEK